MRLLICVLAVLLIQETIAWDIRDWDYKWWKQDTAPAKHHKHHKHHRHHHHRPQTCIPIKKSTTTSGLQVEPSLGPIQVDPFYPNNIGGKLNEAGATCSNLLTTQVVSLQCPKIYYRQNSPFPFYSLLDSMPSFLATLSPLRLRISLGHLPLEEISLHTLTLSTRNMAQTARMQSMLLMDMA